MDYRRLLFASVIVIFGYLSPRILSAQTPPAPGVTMPEAVKEFFMINQATYGQGNLAELMQAYKAQREAVANGELPVAAMPSAQSFRFPVLAGKYSNTGSVLPNFIANLQQELFGTWPTGTMRDFYIENSYGQFELSGDVIGWIKAPQSSSYYEGPAGANGLPWKGGRSHQFVVDLLKAVDDTLDFSRYDNDGDGRVEGVFIVHAGPGGEYGQGNYIWSHRTSLSASGLAPYQTNDVNRFGRKVSVNDYIMQPERSSGGGLIQIGVFCHEFGHLLGLPDLYDTDDTSEGVGGWCLMSSGSYGGDQRHPEKPAHMSAWCKEKLGWVIPKVVSSNVRNFAVANAEFNPVVYKIWKGGAPGQQYFLIENRQRLGFDESLTGPGLLIWHIDNARGGNTNEAHKLVDLEEADGLRDLDFKRNRGDAGDPFPGASRNITFDEFSNPDSRDYANAPTQVAVWNISPPGDSMVVNIEVKYERPRFTTELIWLREAGGNRNGRVEAGERGQLAIKVSNQWADLRDLSVTASADDPRITFQQATVNFGNILSKQQGNNLTQPFALTVAPTFPVRRVNFSLQFAGSIPTGRFSAIQQVKAMVGIPEVLLVDDDNGGTFESFFQVALDSLGLPYDDSSWQTTGQVTAGLRYKTMIWFTGNAADPVLTPAEQDSLRAHLAKGGRVFLTGMNIAENLARQGSSFLRQVLHASWASNIVDGVIHGVRGDVVGGDFKNVAITGGDGARNQISADVLVPDSLAAPVMVYDTTANKVAAIRIEDRAQRSRLVFFGFGFEGINNQVQSRGFATRDQVLSKVLTWLGGDLTSVAAAPGIAELPATYALEQNYPNPFNPTTTISFRLPHATFVTLKVYDLLGHEVAVLVNEKKAAGKYEVRFATSSLAGGVYFYRLHAGEFIETKKLMLLR